MKIIISPDFGGFGGSRALKEWGEKFGVKDEWGCVDWEFDSKRGLINRTNLTAIKIVENCNNEWGSEDYEEDENRVEVVEIPNEATDWRILDFDGSEFIVYALNGELHFLGW